MKIRIDDRDLLVDLRDHLRGVGCIAFEVAPDMLQVAIADAPTAAHERRELDSHLATWARRHDVEVGVLDEAYDELFGDPCHARVHPRRDRTWSSWPLRASGEARSARVCPCTRPGPSGFASMSGNLISPHSKQTNAPLRGTFTAALASQAGHASSSSPAKHMWRSKSRTSLRSSAAGGHSTMGRGPTRRPR